jgi:hypothetical protein
VVLQHTSHSYSVVAVVVAVAVVDVLVGSSHLVGWCLCGHFIVLYCIVLYSIT